MSDSRALDIATAYLDAWTAGDFDSVARLLADDFAFDGPIAHYRSADEFLAGSRAFVESIEPRWRKVSAFGHDREALLLYDLFPKSGREMRVADRFTVAAGRIRTEQIVFDTHGLR